MYMCKILEEATKSLHATNKTQHNQINKYFSKILEEKKKVAVFYSVHPQSVFT